MKVAREAHFSGQSYLDLSVGDVPTLRNNFYTSFSFRTEQKEGLMFYHRDQVGDPFPLCSQSRLPFQRRFNRGCVCVSPSAQDGVCQVFLSDGHVVVRAGTSEVKTQKTYNDANSHYISIYNNLNGYVLKVKSNR